MRRAKSDPVVLIVCEDITQRKHAEETLRESEERFRRMAETIPEVIWIMAFEPERLLYVSRGFERIWGLPAEDLYRDSRLWLASVHPEDRARATSAFTRWLADAGGSTFDVEYRIVQPNGAIRWIHDRGVLIRNEQGQAYRAHGIAEDITERKRAEEALRQTQAELAHVTRVMTMGALTASIAHEVNQPLAAVVTNGNACLRWLARAEPDLEEARAAVERIIRDGHRASEVIRRMRALAQKTDHQKAWLDLNDVIREVVALMHSEVRQQRMALWTDLVATLPPVLGDRVQLQQVILNLLINGIEAMQAVTGRPREVRIRSQRHEADTVLVAVQDAGIGLDPQQMARLFDAFFTTKPGGMGMGLAISRMIIEAHGGRLWATPNDGPGATFQFTLPLNSEHPS